MNAKNIRCTLTFFLSACGSPRSSFANDVVAGAALLEVFVRGDEPFGKEMNVNGYNDSAVS